MYAKGKGTTVPSDAQAREKLALYVYEYLLHVGAQKAAQTFLSEIRWEKNITLGEPPGFLHSWWCVFWDLYCAAPERRDTCEHSSEAKAFHDYNPTAPSPLNQIPNDGMPGGPMPPAGFFTNSHMRPSPPQQPVSQPSPHSQPPPPPPHSQMMQNQQFMSPRYPPGGPRGPGGVRMPQQVDFNPSGGVPGQPLMPNNMDPSRQGEGDFVGWQPGPGGMNSMNPRLNHPRGQPMGPMAPGGYGGMRPPPPNSMGPGPGPGGPMPPGMGMPPGGGRPWQQPNTSNMNYSSASPGNHYAGPPGSGSGPGPGTPIMPSPQGSSGPYSPASHRMGTPNPGGRDSTGSGGDGMYSMMKPVGPGQFSMAPGGPDGPIGPMGGDMVPPVMNGMSNPGDGMDGMKSSPANGPGTPREDSGPPIGYDITAYGQENDQNESAAILKIKETMQEEAKRFEKETPTDHQDFFMQ
ncbi:sequence-specific single-stranded DNA-binding protein isoform X5 [Dermatophagoides farinae]|uniref:sequence-specific single-stranded DNA-binding protein isoform X5 n=1 Tax=Dermatophagoides farinae TaxID=6954 RepID=UPI001F10FE66|nr:single-stranded DNA-binding protein 3-like isoform X3 [Dermatophagoides farinae]